MKQRLLVVDDETNIRRILQVAFDKAGYHTETACEPAEALSKLALAPVDAVLTDVTMPGTTGYELLRAVKERWPQTPVIIMTAFGTIPQAVQAIRDGAAEYVTKPFDLEHLKKVVATSIQDNRSARPKNVALGQNDEPPFLAASPAMRDVLNLVRQVADSRATVMIGGESGTGKEVVARALHTLSTRNPKPFVAVSCAAIPETLLEAELFGHEKGAFTGAVAAKAGRFEAANAGTLFLDEVGEIPMGVQPKLLRVLQEREFERLGSSKPTKVDVRLVTATHRDLRANVERGDFRLDLLYRLQVVEIHLEPLRNRLEDIEPLALKFLAKYAKDNDRKPLAITDQARERLLAHPWPGNVRELENTMERATVLAPASSEELTADLLPSGFRHAA